MNKTVKRTYKLSPEELQHAVWHYIKINDLPVPKSHVDLRLELDTLEASYYAAE